MEFDLAVTIDIELLECLLEVHAFFFGRQVGRHESDGRLPEFRFGL